jgi:hypothetical protein
MSRTELLNSSGGFSGTLTEYDILGQAWRSTVPTEVVTEVEKSGKKQKTFVTAGGTRIATQSFWFQNAEHLTFNHPDASGASIRSTMANGLVMDGEGADDSPAELDALGGNAGTSTPYITINGNPPQEYPEHHQMFDESPMFVNGQRVSATLDGFAIPFGFAMSLLGSGSALLGRGNDSSVLSNLGIYTRTWSTTSTSPGWEEDIDENGNVTGRTWKQDGTLHVNTFEETWWAGAALFEAGRQTTIKDDPKPDEDYLKKLKKFKNDFNKKCLDQIAAAAKDLEIVGSIDDYLKKIMFYNMTQKGMMDKKGLFEDKDETWNTYSSGSVFKAYAPPNTNNMLIFRGYYGYDGIVGDKVLREKFITQYDSTKGSDLFHEFLHLYLGSNHVELVSALKISATSVVFGDKDTEEDKRKKLNNQASNDINSWIKECSAWYKKEHKK